MAIWPVCPGFAYQFNKTSSTSQGWIHLYQLGWLFAVFMGAFTYIVLSYVFKDPAMFEANRFPWESYAVNQKELLDKEPGKDTVLEGSPARESDSEHGRDLLEKNSEKPIDVVTAV